ncbi:hypothetical protein THAOC_31813 [Thalassiosira oceanica]|uniref:Uncharacterized protein n=1 Tax=Thalassiosira oceanica TaxID=159749 RepID=K0RRP1_THAOC|nr:hypothetical protein THAOC_31813 [Thalassiosira oceanica]|eukprot:EJK49322.1 hypothetical protein THAOC_31813 [Thalassiosira oceanica]
MPKQTAAYLNDAAADAISTGKLFDHGPAGPAALGFYSISQNPFDRLSDTSVATTVVGLIKRTESVKSVFKPLFGDTSYPATYAASAHGMVDGLELQITTAMRDYNLPDLPGVIQWELDRRWVLYLKQCETGDMSYEHLHLNDLTKTIQSSPTLLTAPTQVRTLIQAAMAPTIPAPPRPAPN